MIQKRYQYQSTQGVVWTEWFHYTGATKSVEELNKTEKYQLKSSKLLNEYRYGTED